MRVRQLRVTETIFEWDRHWENKTGMREWDRQQRSKTVNQAVREWDRQTDRTSILDTPALSVLLLSSDAFFLRLSLSHRCWGIVKGKHRALKFFRKRNPWNRSLQSPESWRLEPTLFFNRLNWSERAQLDECAMCIPRAKNPNKSYTLKNPAKDLLKHTCSWFTTASYTPGQHTALWGNFK